jgi:hypothetical protein
MVQAEFWGLIRLGNCLLDVIDMLVKVSLMNQLKARAGAAQVEA